MKGPTIIIDEYAGKGGKIYLIVTMGIVRQAFIKNAYEKWTRMPLKTALLDIGIPGAPTDTTHRLERKFEAAKRNAAI